MIQDDFSSSYNTIAFPVYVMTRSVNNRCNINCVYKQSQKIPKEEEQGEMELDVLDMFTRQYIDAQIHSAVHFYWFGGEPLLRGIDFYRQALLFQKKYGANRTITNTIETNGTLIDENWCTFLKGNNFKVLMQLDGPRHCHNRYCVNLDGKDCFDEVMHGIDLLRKYGIPFQTKATIHDYNVQFPLEMYRFYKENGLRQLQFIPHYSTQNGHVTSWSVQPLSYGYFLCSIFDEWVRHDVGTMNISIFDNTLKIFCRKESSNCMYSPTCGHAAMADAKGNLYACQYFYQEDYKIGNIHDNTITGLMYSRKQMRFGQQKRNGLNSQCKKCSYLKFCNGGCLKDRVGSSSSGEKNHNIFCQAYQLFYKHVSPAMVYMAEEITAGRNSARVMSFFESA